MAGLSVLIKTKSHYACGVALKRFFRRFTLVKSDFNDLDGVYAI